MEQIVTIVSSVGKDGKITHLINDKTYKADENGIATFYINDIMGAEDKGIMEFNRKFELIMRTDEGRLTFYDMVMMNNRFGIGDVGDMLSVDRKVAKEIMTLGLKNKILLRFDTQYKLNPEKKDQVRLMVRQIHEKMGRLDEGPEPFKADEQVVTVPPEEKTTTLVRKRGK